MDILIRVASDAVTSRAPAPCQGSSAPAPPQGSNTPTPPQGSNTPQGSNAPHGSNVSEAGALLVTAAVHALNILRALYRDSRLGEHVVAFIPEGVKVAITGFAANLWPVCYMLWLEF